MSHLVFKLVKEFDYELHGKKYNIYQKAPIVGAFVSYLLTGRNVAFFLYFLLFNSIHCSSESSRPLPSSLILLTIFFSSDISVAFSFIWKINSFPSFITRMM